MPKSKVTRKSKKTTRIVKKTASKSRRPQKTSGKMSKYKKAYDACVEKALATCSKRVAGKKKTIKKSRAVKPTSTKKPRQKSEYNLFVSKHMKDQELEGLKVTEKMKKIGEMWKRR